MYKREVAYVTVKRLTQEERRRLDAALLQFIEMLDEHPSAEETRSLVQEWSLRQSEAFCAELKALVRTAGLMSVREPDDTGGRSRS